MMDRIDSNRRWTPAAPKKFKTPPSPDELAATKAAILKNMRSRGIKRAKFLRPRERKSD